MKKQTALVLLALAFLAVPARTPLRAALALAPLFTDNAVLQRGRPVAVFGSADPGAEIRVAFAGVTANATAGADGRWHATLPALEASAEPRTLSAASAAGQVAVKNILVGEVWLASGQSNMEWTLRQIGDTAAIAAAANPLVRMARVPLNPQPAPAAALPRPVVWLPATPKNAPVFSATAWFFADEIQRALNVPVGIINAAWGGKMIEVFLSEPVLARPEFAKVHAAYADETRRLAPRVEAERKLVAEWNAEKAAAEKSGVPFAKKFPLGALNARAILEQHRPSCLFNGGIHPLGPQTLRGILWYQGEHNTARAADYPPLFKALIADWRAFLGQGDIPFLFCQLSAYGAPLDRSGDSYARLREAQRQVALSGIPATGMAVTLDLGVRDNVHFKNKRPVGHRLALLARALAYGETGLEASGPVLESAVRRGAAVRLTFAHADGLVVRQAAGAPSGFELAGDGGVFHPADASVDGAALMLVCDKVPEPRRVRYAWGNFPAAVTLFNAAGLPASPFVGDIR